MKNTMIIFDTNIDCMVNYGFGMGEQPSVLLKDIEYEVTNLTAKGNKVSFELWDEEGKIGDYYFYETLNK